MFSIRLPFSKRAWLKKAGICIALVGTYFAAKKISVVQRASAQVTATPFIAEMHTYGYKITSMGELIAKRVIARRSDGTTVSIHSAGPIERGWSSRKIQYMDGRFTGIVASITSVIRGSSDASRLAAFKSRMMSVPSDCVFESETRFVGSEVVLGRTLAKIVREAPKTVSTLWRDPQLSCEVLQSAIEERQLDGSLKTVSRMMLVNLSLTAPQPELFEEPSLYRQLAGAKELESRFGEALRSLERP